MVQSSSDVSLPRKKTRYQAIDIRVYGLMRYLLTLFSSDSVFKMNGEPLTSFKYDHGIHMTTQGIFLPMTFTAYNRMLLQFNLIDTLGIRHFAL